MAKRTKRRRRKKGTVKQKLSLLSANSTCENPKKLKEVQPRNFWNTCPLSLDYLPEQTCEYGKCSLKAKAGTKMLCEWGINSEQDNYCFWKWINAHSSSDGDMAPVFQNELAKLMSCSPTKIHSISKKALKNLKSSNYIHYLARLFYDALSSDTSNNDSSELSAALNNIDEDGS